MKWQHYEFQSLGKQWLWRKTVCHIGSRENAWCCSGFYDRLVLMDDCKIHEDIDSFPMKHKTGSQDKI